MGKLHFQTLLLAVAAVFAASVLSREVADRPVRARAAPMENLIIEESPYAKPYLPEIVGRNQQGWRCDASGLRDEKNREGTCYDLNGGEFRMRIVRAPGRGAIERIFKKYPNEELVEWARFERKVEVSRNVLLYEHPDAKAYRLAKVGGTDGSVAGRSPVEVGQPQSPDTQTTPEGAAAKALGTLFKRLPSLPK